MSKYVKLTKARKLISSKGYMSGGVLVVGVADILEYLDDLPTKELDDQEFRVGDEVWFLKLDINLITNTASYVPTSCFYDGFLVTCPATLATERDKQKVVSRIYKTEQEAEEALKELNNE